MLGQVPNIAITWREFGSLVVALNRSKFSGRAFDWRRYQIGADAGLWSVHFVPSIEWHIHVKSYANLSYFSSAYMFSNKAFNSTALL